MSQFMVVVGKKMSRDDIGDLEYIHVKDADDFIQSACRDLVKESDLPYCLIPQDSPSKCTDTLFVEAQERLVEGAKISETRLGLLIREMIRGGGSLILWYGCDWVDLPETSDSGQVLLNIKKQLLEGSGEVYLRYLAQADPFDARTG